MPVATIVAFPRFDTGQFEGAEFLMARGNAELVTHVAGEDDVVVSFVRVRWHQFTAMYNCSAEQLEGAYFSVAEVIGSESLSRYLIGNKASTKAYEALHHFRVFLDEHGCHEVFAESAALIRRARHLGQPPNKSLERTREG